MSDSDSDFDFDEEVARDRRFERRLLGKEALIVAVLAVLVALRALLVG